MLIAMTFVSNEAVSMIAGAVFAASLAFVHKSGLRAEPVGPLQGGQAPTSNLPRQRAFPILRRVPSRVSALLC